MPRILHSVSVVSIVSSRDAEADRRYGYRCLIKRQPPSSSESSFIHFISHPIYPLCTTTVPISPHTQTMKSTVSLAALLPLLASASPVHVSTIHSESAPILSSSNSEVIPNSYLVVFKDHVDITSAKEHTEWVQDLHVKAEDSKMELRKRSQLPLMDELFEGLKHTIHIPGSLLGYSGHFDDEVVEQVRRHPDVSCRLITVCSCSAQADYRNRLPGSKETQWSTPWILLNLKRMLPGVLLVSHTARA